MSYITYYICIIYVLYVFLLAFAGFSWVFGTPHGRTSNSGGPPTRFCPNRFLADLQLGIDGILDIYERANLFVTLPG